MPNSGLAADGAAEVLMEVAAAAGLTLPVLGVSLLVAALISRASNCPTLSVSDMDILVSGC